MTNLLDLYFLNTPHMQMYCLKASKPIPSSWTPSSMTRILAIVAAGAHPSEWLSEVVNSNIITIIYSIYI